MWMDQQVSDTPSMHHGTNLEVCRIVEAVNTRAVGQTKLRVAQNDRTIVWSFKSGHYRRYMVVKTKKRRCVTI